uniref:TraB domain-containing protein n=1 Tax=Cacopsylla melanoneura TaxID=428564 RepID=A0A8D8LRG5_9HEMI
MGINDDKDIDEQDLSLTEETINGSIKSTPSSTLTSPRDDAPPVPGSPSQAAAPAVPTDDLSLSWMPSTVTLLRNEHTGAEIYLVGTAHFSRESQDDVSLVIQRVRPNIVLVELCRSRAPILSMDEAAIEAEARDLSVDKMKATVSEHGLVQGMMYLLFLNMSAQLTKKLGMAPGGEFRRALSEVKKLDYCNIHFGDRPITITIKRALSCLSWWQTLKLFATLLFKDCNISAEEVEKCKQKDLLEQMLDEMSAEYPELGHVFVHERDLYLTWSIQYISNLVTVNNTVVVNEVEIDPEIPRNPVRIVAVVGIGHVPGITQLWGSVTREDIEPILVIPPPSKTGQVIKWAFKISLLSLTVWGIVRVTPKIGRGVLHAVKVLPKIVSK